MTKKLRQGVTDRVDALPPFPEGWYFVATRRSILREKLIEKTWLGEEIVAWSGEDGRIAVVDAYCPHLGSHMGPTVGGVVRDGCLVCPFHGFQFDTAGDCVATPNAPPPRAAKLRVYETREILGMVFAWWGVGGRAPQWELPDAPSAGSEWSRLRSHTYRFRGHPQETTENSVDLEHLSYTHGYSEVAPVGSITIEGAYLKSCFDFRNVTRIPWLRDIVSDISTVTHVHGLGYSFVEFRDRTIGIHARLWVLATPVDGTLIEMRLVSQARDNPKPGRFITGLGFLPMRLRRSVMNLVLIRREKWYVGQDVTIWERKRYRSPPRLCRADGPIGKYRLYCRQFYSEPEAGRGGAASRSV